MQQINLYRPIFRKQEKKFSALAMLQAGAAVIAGIFVIYGLMAWHVQGLRRDLTREQARFAKASNDLENVASKLGAGGGDNSVQTQIAALEQQLASRLRVQQMLDRGLFSNTTGYSDFFVAFARQNVPGVWLTGFDIVGKGEDMRLEGRTNDPAQVPRFVQKLSAEQALSGKEFQVFVMTRPERKDGEAEAPYVEFQFKTAPAAKTDKAEPAGNS